MGRRRINSLELFGGQTEWRQTEPKVLKEVRQGAD